MSGREPFLALRYWIISDRAELNEDTWNENIYIYIISIKKINSKHQFSVFICSSNNHIRNLNFPYLFAAGPNPLRLLGSAHGLRTYGPMGGPEYGPQCPAPHFRPPPRGN